MSRRAGCTKLLMAASPLATIQRENNMMRSLMFAIASCTAFGLMALAPASAATGVRSAERVSYADLNLDNRAGAQIMLRRIRQAAGYVCGDSFGRLSLREHLAIRRCSRAATEQAVRDVGNANLMALYYGRRPDVTVAER